MPISTDDHDPRPVIRESRARRAIARLVTIVALVAQPATAIANWSSDPRVNLAICTAAGDQGMPALLADGYGGAWIVWNDTRISASHSDIYATHILPQGIVDPSWPVDGLAVCTAWSSQMEPRVVSDGGSGVFIAWWDQRTSASNPDLYMQHVLENGTVDPAWPVNGAPVVTTLDLQYPPHLLADGAGGAFLCFGDNNGTSNNVYAQHMLGSGVHDPAWTPYGLPLCNVAGSQLYPDAILDGSGGMLVAWGDDRASVGGVYATRVLGSGSLHPDWPANGFAVCTSTIDISSVKLVSDGTGGAIVTWSDKRGSQAGDIYAQHLLLDGTIDPGWPADGLPVCTAPGLQAVPQILADGAHGAIIIWWDQRSGTYDLHAHHVLPAGVVDPAWPVNGRAFCAAPGNQRHARGGLIPDGAGGALCAWRDERPGALVPDIYAGHLLASGLTDPGWPENGLGVCEADSNQSGAAVCSDGSGGLIVAWPDKRSGAWDLYAQRVDANGSLPNVGVGNAALTSSRMESPRPNPAIGSTMLRFELESPGRTRLEVFDIRGRVIAVLVDRQLPAGAREERWDLTDAAGRPVPPGLYFARVLAAGRVMTSRIAVIER